MTDRITDRITDFETYSEYVADRASKKQDVVSEFLFDALKKSELWNEVPRLADGYAEFEDAWKEFEVKDDSLKLDPTKPAYIVRVR